MSDIIDLDLLVPADTRVSFKGHTYVLPGDMPMATFLRISKISQDQESGATQEQLLGETVEALVELFCWRRPESDEEARTRLRETFSELGVKTVMAIVSTVYPNDDEADDEPDLDAVAEDPTPPESGTTTPTTSQPE